VADPVTLIADPLEARLIPSDALRVALVVPVSGVLGLVGPCAINCAVLAAAEVNASGGVLGRRVELVLVDGGRRPPQVAAEVSGLARAGAIQAVVGTHGSDVRIAITRALRAEARPEGSAVALTPSPAYGPDAVPFVYTPPYEGGGRDRGVYFLGETPARQVGPALDWLIDKRRARRWFLLGNDYVWPRLVHAAAARHLASRSVSIVGERFVPYGIADPYPLLEELALARPDAVLLDLIGSDLITFNRAFATSGLRCARLCGALEEHGLLGIGGDTTGDLYAAMGYFGGVPTEESLSLGERYANRFGADAPLLNGHGQGCYEGVLMLAALAGRAGTLAVPAVEAVADGTTVVSARGPVTLSGRHVRQRVYMGRADGLGFDVITSL
jgi:ABC-type branched-subunit amino acid transport system substrate-binding protein